MTAPRDSLTLTDRVDPARAAALHAILGRPGPAPESGDSLPPFAHRIYFWEPVRPEERGPDGHRSAGDGLIPDFGLPRRMWAGGHLVFHGPFRAGIQASRTSRVLRTARKTGRLGEMAFVTLRHEVTQRGALVISEDQDLVYLPADTDRPEPPRAPSGGRLLTSVRFDAVDLFAYSALTLNGHRIHYDDAFARNVEGYPGLVVHGPLLAQHLMLAAAETGALVGFSYRATAPLFAGEMGEIRRDGNAMWITGPGQRLCMSAEVTPGS